MFHRFCLDEDWGIVIPGILLRDDVLCLRGAAAAFLGASSPATQLIAASTHAQLLDLVHPFIDIWLQSYKSCV